MKNSIQIPDQKDSATQEQPFKWPSTFIPSAYLSETKMEYRRRFVISVGLSVFLNLFILWIFLSSHGRTHPVSIKTKNERNATRLVLIERTPSKTQTFLETDPSQASKEKPQNPDFYSEHNTVAAQTSPSEMKSSEIPKADGKNTKTMATETVRLSMPKPPPPPEHMPNSQDKQSAQSSVKPVQKNPVELPKNGDLALLKQNPSERPSSQEQPEDTSKSNPQTSPRAPPVAPAPSSSREIPTSKSRLEGGARVGKAMQFNSSESPFAKYDKKVIAKISTYWQYQIVDRFSGEKVGQVEISFKLMDDGRVSEIQIIRNTANVILASWCIQAIEKSIPFEPFPESMRVLVGSYREATITFTY